MPRRLSYPSNLSIWIAFVLGLLLFAAAMAIALWRLGPYDGSVARHHHVVAAEVTRV
ncbi:MAG TPA: hypothetical protein VHO29_08675 [Marmoricola sp.]|nr:hypothetical protein [Marmoricola sp.]